MKIRTLHDLEQTAPDTHITHEDNPSGGFYAYATLNGMRTEYYLHGDPDDPNARIITAKALYPAMTKAPPPTRR